MKNAVTGLRNFQKTLNLKQNIFILKKNLGNGNGDGEYKFPAPGEFTFSGTEVI